MMGAQEPAAVWVSGESAQLAWGVAEERTADGWETALQLVRELHQGVHGPGPWLGGVAFPSGTPWPDFPAARFIRAERWETVPTAELAEGVPPGAEASLPGEMSEGWSRRVACALDEIASGALEKVVLARELEFSTLHSGWNVFRRLLGSAVAARHFFIRARNGACFLGATPETLVRLSRASLTVDALAGSVPVGSSFGEKEQREHRIVVRDIEKALHGLSPEVPKPQVMRLPYVWHLHTPVRARVDERFDLRELLQKLFPTSAVAGSPRDRALDFIAQHEGIQRGWYAGAVGRVSPQDVDLAVALRCLWLGEGRARVFAGAGLVAGSQAQAEWEEIARKTLPARRALGIGGARERLHTGGVR